MPKLIDLTNRRFGRWIVLKRSPNKKKEVYWLCECDCGSVREVRAGGLITGFSKSCGCLQAEIVSKNNSIERGLRSKNTVYYNYKKSAEYKNIPFELSFEQFLELTQKNCFYCNLEPSTIWRAYRDGGNGGFKYNGIDRMDNSKGYTLDNCVPCCTMCNKAKRDNSYKEFMSWIERIVFHNYKRLGFEH